MPKIVYLNIHNFRSIKELSWKPNHGMNCLIGGGDSGKTTVLDAIDYCLGARRSAQFSDYDFIRPTPENQ
ncbi:AAA family ATPase [uncultured Roseobacter sp.]|uniref:AAA family ATPase n=1 Tax=uncultured Roseobacter sp. TaxID=114847 RepID=UPI00345C6FD5